MLEGIRRSSNRTPAPTGAARLASARSLAARLPELLVDAKRIASSFMFGVHGRRRAGPGETFWQFRSYIMGEPSKQIDWRRSARDRHLYVREREWEAAQTVWLWADLSRSMDFSSKLSKTTKAERALVLTLAVADMLGRGGEKVGWPGLTDARSGRDSADRLAEAIARFLVDPNADPLVDWPQTDRIGRHADLLIVSDCLAETEKMRDRIRQVAGLGARLHLLQILDPAEETFPYDGRLEFRDPETGEIWLAERAGSLQLRYQDRIAAHRESMAEIAQHAGFGFGLHHTDRPASEGLLFLYNRLANSGARTGVMEVNP